MSPAKRLRLDWSEYIEIIKKIGEGVNNFKNKIRVKVRG